MVDFETMAKTTFIRQYERTGVRPVGFARLTWWWGVVSYALGLVLLVVFLAADDDATALAVAIAPLFTGYLMFVLRNNALLAAGAALLLADQSDAQTPPSHDADSEADAQTSSSSEEGSTGGASFSLRRSTE